VQFAHDAARDYAFVNSTNHRRRTKKPFEVGQDRAMELAGGVVLDLRDAVTGGLHPRRATTVACAVPVSGLNITRIRQAATDSAFPDKAILDELEFGLDHKSTTPRKTRIAAGHAGAFRHQDKITAALEAELDEKDPAWLQGPFAYPPFWPLRCVERNVVEQLRPDKIKYRITTDMSEANTPDSINAGIDLGLEPPHKMCRILEFAQAAAILESTGQRVYAWMYDLSAAYRQIPVATDLHWAQCFVWKTKFYVDLRGVFGDRSLVHKFTRIANLLVWVIRGRIRRRRRTAQGDLPDNLVAWLRHRTERLGEDQAVLHWGMEYIDDYGGLSIGAAEANHDLDEALAVLQEFNLPPSWDKVVRPTRTGDLLGCTFDLDQRLLRLAESFLWKLRRRTRRLLDATDEERSFADLEKVVYYHAHVVLFEPALKPEAASSFAFYRKAKATRPRPFRLTAEFQQICERFLVVDGNGSAMPLAPALWFPRRGSRFRIDVESDASGDTGWGVILLPAPDTPDFVFYAADAWQPAEADAHINMKELYVTLLAAFLFGDIFVGASVMEAIDNTVARAVAANNKTGSPQLRRIQKHRIDRHLAVGWKTRQQYIRSKDNDLADALSRGDHDGFMEAVRRRGIPPGRLRRLTLDDRTRNDLTSLLQEP